LLIVFCFAGAVCNRLYPTQDQPFLLRECRMIVEIDIFSGRPNPSWELSPQQVIELQRRVSALRQQLTPSPLFDGLGYRGLIVRDPSDPGSFLKVGFSRILSVKGGVETIYDDEGRMLEKWLFGTGKGKVDDRLITAPNLD
jgi:hypothetical protein